jgi:hypothetical protein
MLLVVAATFALIVWIVLWALGFGRVGDAFIVSVPIIVVAAAMLRTVARDMLSRRDT